MPSLISSATSLPSMAAKKAESLASSTSAETAYFGKKRGEREPRGVHGFARLATVRTRAAGGGSDVRGDARRWITRRHAPEARTALTSASEGSPCRRAAPVVGERDGRGKGLAENPNTRKHELGCSRGGRARASRGFGRHPACDAKAGGASASPRMPRPDSRHPRARTPPTVGREAHRAFAFQPRALGSAGQ